MHRFRKMTRQEKILDRQTRQAEALKGEGLFIYKNNVKGTLSLPKPTASGKQTLQLGEEFQGDSYFMSLVRTNELRFIRTITPVEPKGESMQEQKLILDQPDKVTAEGAVEQVVPAKPLNENIPTENQKQILLTEDPMDGIEIVMN